MENKRRLVVIGNGMAGARLVEEVMDRGGGDLFDIIVFGEESCGNYNRILLSGVLEGSHQPQDIFINPISWYEERGITLHAGVKAGWIDRISKAVYASGGVVEPYDKLVIATGSTPFIPPMSNIYDGEGGLRPGLFTFRTLDDCNDILQYAGAVSKVAVIGGGLLGLEAARGLLGRGLEVHVAHLQDHLMETQLDQTAGAVLKKALENMGLRIHLEKGTNTVLGNGRVEGLLFNDGSSLDCEMVVVAAGVRPNVDLAKHAGLAVQRGIIVRDDLSCRNEPDVYAIGECAQHRDQLYGLVAPLWEQARVLADRLTGQDPDATYRGSRISTKLKVLGVDLAVMGDRDPQSEDDELVHYSEQKRNVYKKLIVRDGKLAGAILLGDGEAVPNVLQAFDRQSLLPENRAELLFPLMGEGHPQSAADLPDHTLICSCNGVSKGKIAQAVEQGNTTLQEVCGATRAGTCCGSCKSQIQAVLELSVA